MNLTTTLLALALIASGYGQTSQVGSVHNSLERWSGKDLLKESKAEQTKFIAFVDSLLPKQTPVEDLFENPSTVFMNKGHGYVWKLTPALGERFLVYLAPQVPMTPGAAHAHAWVVDSEGHPIGKSDFYLGWRMWTDGAAFSKVSWLSEPVLIQHMETGINGDGPRKIYMALDGDHLVVVRLDDELGQIRPMDYYAPNFVVGPIYHPPTKEALKSALAGSNEVKRLGTMVWLAGSHDHYEKRESHALQEDETDEIRYAQDIKDSEVAALTKKLRSNSNRYVRQLAGQIPIGVGLYEEQTLLRGVEKMNRRFLEYDRKHRSKGG